MITAEQAHEISSEISSAKHKIACEELLKPWNLAKEKYRPEMEAYMNRFYADVQAAAKRGETSVVPGPFTLALWDESLVEERQLMFLAWFLCSQDITNLGYNVHRGTVSWRGCGKFMPEPEKIKSENEIGEI